MACVGQDRTLIGLGSNRTVLEPDSARAGADSDRTWLGSDRTVLEPDSTRAGADSDRTWLGSDRTVLRPDSDGGDRGGVAQVVMFEAIPVEAAAVEAAVEAATTQKARRCLSMPTSPNRAQSYFPAFRSRQAARGCTPLRHVSTSVQSIHECTYMGATCTQLHT